MEGEQFSLCWNNFHSNLSSGFHSLLTSEDLVDVTLAAEGKYIKAHKTVLSVCSPYFKELFRVNPCKHPIVILQDVNYEALKSILQFMYKGEVSVNQDEIPVFMKVAELLQIKGLTNNNSDANSNGTGNDDDSSNQDNTSTLNKVPLIRTSILKRPKQSPSAPPPIQKRPRTSYPASPKATSTAGEPVKSTRVTATPPKRPSTASPAPPTMPPLLPVEKVTVDSLPVKQEPEEIDEDRNYDDSTYSEGMDVSSMLHTSLGEGSDATGSWSPDLKPNDSTSPGSLQFIKSRKGHPVLIYNGHMYTLSHQKDAKSTWVCVKQKKLNCEGCVTTANGPMLLSYSGHNHAQLNDIIQRIQAFSCSPTL